VAGYLTVWSYGRRYQVCPSKALVAIRSPSCGQKEIRICYIRKGYMSCLLVFFASWSSMFYFPFSQPVFLTFGHPDRKLVPHIWSVNLYTVNCYPNWMLIVQSFFSSNTHFSSHVSIKFLKPTVRSNYGNIFETFVTGRHPGEWSCWLHEEKVWKMFSFQGLPGKRYVCVLCFGACSFQLWQNVGLVSSGRATLY